jgi:23S rRNA (uracil1939-C5)-methyltransferase
VDDLIGSVRCPGSTEATIRVGGRTGDRMLIVDGDPAGVSAPADVAIASSTRPDAVSITEVVAGRTLRVSGGTFFQSSPQGADELVRLVEEALVGVDRSGVLVDAYCGGGLFSATVGSQWTDLGTVLAVELNPASVSDAAVNAPHALVAATRFEDWDAVPADAVIADPARSGLARAGVDKIVETGAEVVVLVSCDAGAMGRDAGLLRESGYAATDVSVVDMFNQTSHVEVVSRFERVA